MASKSITIKDTKDAITKGIIPGEFNADKTEFNFKEIVSINSRKKKTTWKLRVRLLNDKKESMEIKDQYLTPPIKQLPEGWLAEITVDSKQEGGKVRDIVPNYVKVGKNLGKSNVTNIVTQSLRDALSLYNKQSKKANPAGSAKIAPESKDPDDNIDSKLKPLPMALKKMGSATKATLTDVDFKNGVIVQRKFNGVRVVAFLHDEKVKFYSRAGNNYPGMDHIRDQLLPVLKNPPKIEGLTLVGSSCEIKNPSIYKKDGRTVVYLDGEFYLHGKPLEYISGQSRKEKGELMIEFHLYDCFFPTAIEGGDNMISRCRQSYLDLLFKELKSAPDVKRVENFTVHSNAEIDKLMNNFITQGNEGAVARRDLGLYKYSFNSYHSDDVLKVKKVKDDEFKIVGFKEGKKGKDVGALIWIVEVEESKAKDKNDRTFSVVPKNMTLEERKKMYACLKKEVKNDAGDTVTIFTRDFLGKPLTVEYMDISDKTGKPLQAKAITVRTYEDPKHDVMKAAYDECKKDMNLFPTHMLSTV